ncbi:hypothetical protein C2S52_000932 [Perilla frutescens var. hirtella]|nr:hypothetical protein C2S52_000932 [Perilla frutescens var. hirtella]
MAVKGKRGEGPINPVLFKFGVALAFSIGGIVFTFLRSKRIMLPKPKPSPRSPGKRSQADSDVGANRLAMENLSIPRIPSQNSMSETSSSGGGRSVVDRDSFLLSEFDQLLKEYDMATDDVSPRRKRQSIEPNAEPPKEHKCAEHEERERELRSLRSKVEILEEREKILENQLLEYYGLKEQESAVLELQTRLRVHNMEAKLYNLKIESLQSDNKRLQAKVADYEKVVAELESSQAKITLLRKKLRVEAEQNREQILKLQERVMMLQDQDKKAVEIDQDVDMQPQEKNRLEEELEEMKKYNESLKLENLELAQKVENLQKLAKSALDNEEVQELKEESQLLRQQNENFRKEIDQLQTDRCTDVEELVYLRWINACLRYELRNYQPGPGETVARDLSKSLSPKSEEKAKNLILAYANREGSGGKDPDISDFYFDEWSISQTSYLTDSGEPDDLPTDILQDNKSNHPNKKKVFAKLMKLLRGKDNDHHIQTPSSPRERASSVDDVASRYSVTSRSGIDADGLTKTTPTSSGASSSQSFDLQRSYSRGQKSATAESSYSSRRTSDDVSLTFAALEMLNHAPLKGKSIRIMWYETDPVARKNNNGNLFVKNLDKSITSARLQEIFSRYGTILSCKVAEENGISKGFGFIQFGSEGSAIAARTALHEALLEGKKLYVSKFLRKNERNGEEVVFRNLFVKNLDEDITAEVLKAKFSEHGKVSNAVIIKDEKGKSKGFGFVYFDSHETAKRAMECLNGELLGSKNIVVAKAVKKSEVRKNFRQMSKASNMFSKNLDGSVGDKKSEDLFSGYGTANSAKPFWHGEFIKRFSHFSCPYGTKKALNSLTGSNLDGRTLNVAVAKLKEHEAIKLHKPSEKFPPQPFYASNSQKPRCNFTYFTSAIHFKPPIPPFHPTASHYFASPSNSSYPIIAQNNHGTFRALPMKLAAMNGHKQERYLEMPKDKKPLSPVKPSAAKTLGMESSPVSIKIKQGCTLLPLVQNVQQQLGSDSRRVLKSPQMAGSSQ